jgi:hypothetical protein
MASTQSEIADGGAGRVGPGVVQLLPIRLGKVYQMFDFIDFNEWPWLFVVLNMYTPVKI